MWGEAIRRIALVGLLVHAAGTLAGAVLVVWIAQGLPGVTAPAGMTFDGPPRPADTLAHLAELLWLPAYLCLVYGNRRMAGIWALVALAPGLIFVATVSLDGVGGVFQPALTYQLLFNAVPLLALAAFHRSAPPVRVRPWLVALPVAVALLVGLDILTLPTSIDAPTLLDWPGLWCVGIAAAALVHLALTVGRRDRNAPHWALALALLALGVWAFGWSLCRTTSGSQTRRWSNPRS